jgi:hypothetical protein
MKTTKTNIRCRGMLVIFVLTSGLTGLQAELADAAPMGTAFTHQGWLIHANSAADGLYDFQFKFFDDPNLVLRHTTDRCDRAERA